MKHSDETHALELLSDAIAKMDADAVEDSVVSACSASFVPLLMKLLALPWHRQHEEIVSTFQFLKDARTVDALYEASFARHEYLSYDSRFGLARKCTWALADIGTPEAREKLELLASGENPLIASYAQKRLDRWNDEQKRKGA